MLDFDGIVLLAEEIIVREQTGADGNERENERRQKQVVLDDLVVC